MTMNQANKIIKMLPWKVVRQMQGQVLENAQCFHMKFLSPLGLSKQYPNIELKVRIGNDEFVSYQDWLTATGRTACIAPVLHTFDQARIQCIFQDLTPNTYWATVVNQAKDPNDRLMTICILTDSQIESFILKQLSNNPIVSPYIDKDSNNIKRITIDKDNPWIYSDKITQLLLPNNKDPASRAKMVEEITQQGYSWFSNFELYGAMRGALFPYFEKTTSPFWWQKTKISNSRCDFDYKNTLYCHYLPAVIMIDKNKYENSNDTTDITGEAAKIILQPVVEKQDKLEQLEHAYCPLQPEHFKSDSSTTVNNLSLFMRVPHHLSGQVSVADLNQISTAWQWNDKQKVFY